MAKMLGMYSKIHAFAMSHEEPPSELERLVEKAVEYEEPISRNDVTLLDLFARRTGPLLTIGSIERLSNRFFSYTSILRDIERGHLPAHKLRLIGDHESWVVQFADARDYLRMYRPKNIADLAPRGVWPERDRRVEDWPCVYFLQSGPFIKIGMTVCVERRIKYLGLNNPHEMVCIHQVRYPRSALCRALEQELHQRFVAFRHRGEWFHDCSEIRNYISLSKAEAA